jgi:hypothetical protein
VSLVQIWWPYKVHFHSKSSLWLLCQNGLGSLQSAVCTNGSLQAANGSLFSLGLPRGHKSITPARSRAGAGDDDERRRLGFSAEHSAAAAATVSLVSVPPPSLRLAIRIGTHACSCSSHTEFLRPFRGVSYYRASG